MSNLLPFSPPHLTSLTSSFILLNELEHVDDFNLSFSETGSNDDSGFPSSTIRIDDTARDRRD